MRRVTLRIIELLTGAAHIYPVGIDERWFRGSSSVYFVVPDLVRDADDDVGSRKASPAKPALYTGLCQAADASVRQKFRNLQRVVDRDGYGGESR